jgi:hypothetical protein
MGKKKLLAGCIVRSEFSARKKRPAWPNPDEENPRRDICLLSGEVAKF